MRERLGPPNLEAVPGYASDGGGSRSDAGVAGIQHNRSRQPRGDTENMGPTVSCAKAVDRGNTEGTDARKLMWVKGHGGFTGDEEADRRAKMEVEMGGGCTKQIS